MIKWTMMALLIGISAAPGLCADGDLLSVLDEEMIVTTTRIEQELGRTASTVSVIRSAEITSRQIEKAVDAVRTVPGAYPAGGSPGAPTSLFLRGTASNQNVVLLDGVQVNDPTIGGQFNWFDLGVDNIDRIEVLRGAASTLYGSEGAGGVVSLITRRGHSEPTARLGIEGGSFGHYRGSIGGQGSLGEMDVSLAASHARWRNDRRNQEYVVDSLSGRLGFELAEGYGLSIIGRYVDSEAEDPWDFPFGAQIEEDENIKRERATGLVGIALDGELSPVFSFRLAGSLFDANSLFTNGGDLPGDPIELRSRAEAQVRNLMAMGTADVPGILDGLDGTFVVGIEYEDEISLSRVKSAFGASPELSETTRNRAAFALAEFEILERLTLGGGLRRDRNSFFGYETTASASALYRLEDWGTKIRANYGEAFRGPKPVEFADPWVGNPDLESESSVSIDFGVEQELLDGAVVLGVAWFQVRTSDLIAYDFGTFRLENLARARVRGFEFQAAVEPIEGLLVRGWLTLQDPRDLSAEPGAQRRLPGRSKRFGGGDVEYRGDGWLAGVEVHASDDYPGQGRITPDGIMRSHPGRKLIVTLRGEVEVASGVRVFGRLENLLDDEWYDADERPDGLGRGFYAGLDVDF